MRYKAKKILENSLQITYLIFLKLLPYFYFPKKNKITDVLFLTFRQFYPEGGAGGGGAVMSAQKVIFGQKLIDLNIHFQFFESNFFSKKGGSLSDLLGAIYFGIIFSKKTQAKIYLTHDYGTAVGLRFSGKKYIFISHLQGPRVLEKTNYGERVNFIEKAIINYLEKKAFMGARKLSFPSKGAMEMYVSNIKDKKIFDKINLGPPMYNTLYAAVQVKKIDLEINDTLKILSIGHLTLAKGQDMCIPLIEAIINLSVKKVSYILVGDGVERKRLLERLLALQDRYPNKFFFYHFPKLEYAEVLYVQHLADVYIMLHRVSIFDLSTLEMMSIGKKIVLSRIGGNLEFNTEENIIFFNGDITDTAKKIVDHNNYNRYKKLNIHAYSTHFSPEAFRKRYHKLIKEVL